MDTQQLNESLIKYENYLTGFNKNNSIVLAEILHNQEKYNMENLNFGISLQKTKEIYSKIIGLNLFQIIPSTSCGQKIDGQSTWMNDFRLNSKLNENINSDTIANEIINRIVLNLKGQIKDNQEKTVAKEICCAHLFFEFRKETNKIMPDFILAGKEIASKISGRNCGKFSENIGYIEHKYGKSDIIYISGLDDNEMIFGLKSDFIYCPISLNKFSTILNELNLLTRITLMYSRFDFLYKNYESLYRLAF